jgi:hypothetical protein
MWVYDVIVQMIKDTWIGIKWIFRSIFIDRPKGRKDVRDFFKEMWVAMKALAQMIREDPVRGLLNFFGGLFFYITHHSVEFTAQVVLLLGIGFGVIGQFTDAVKTALDKAKVASGITDMIRRVCYRWFQQNMES